MPNLPFFTNKRKATEQEQLDAAEQLKAPSKLPSFLLDEPQEELSSQDRINLQKDKLKEAGQIMSEPAEYDELDTSGYLPNQQMAGQGAWKTIRSALALQPREEEYPVIGNDPITGKPMRFDPTATMGIIKDAKQIGEIAAGLKNPTKQQVLDALEYKPNKDRLSFLEQNQTYRNLLNSATKKYLNTNKNLPTEKIINELYPGLSDVPMHFDTDLIAPDGRRALGRFASSYLENSKALIPKKLELSPNAEISTFLHELQHGIGNAIEPFEIGKNKILDPRLFTMDKFPKKELQDRVLLINPNITKKEFEEIYNKLPKKDVNSILKKLKQDPYDFSAAGHFTGQNYNNFELDKAVELLNNSPTIMNKDAIKNNIDLLKSLENEKTLNKEQAKQFLNERGFQSIDQLLKKKP